MLNRVIPCFFALWSAVSVAGPSSIRELNFSGFGYGKTPEGCQSSLEEVATGLQQRLGVNIVSVGCVVTVGGSYRDGRIAFNGSDEEVFSSAGSSYAEFDGVYSDASQCEQGLAREVSFLKQHGVDPFLAYCTKRSMIGQGQQLFTPLIYGIGKGDVVKLSSSVVLRSRPADGNPRQVAALFQREGLTLMHVGVRDHDRGFVAEYYQTKGAPKLFFTQWDKLNWPSRRDCELAATSLRSHWAGPKLAPIVICGADQNGGVTGSVVDLGPITFEYRVSLLPKVYSGLEACFGDEARVREAVGQPGQPGYGTLCGLGEGGQVQMAAFYMQ